MLRHLPHGFYEKELLGELGCPDVSGNASKAPCMILHPVHAQAFFLSLGN